MNGVVLSYTKARLLHRPSQADGPNIEIYARTVDEYGASYVWLTADFILLKPDRGSWVEGYVNVQSESHLGLLCWNLFNASVERKQLPHQWRWVVGNGATVPSQAKKLKPPASEENGEGHYVDENGDPVQGLLRIRVRDFEPLSVFGAGRSFLRIEGTLLSVEEEEERAKLTRASSRRMKSALKAPAAGASRDGIDAQMMQADGAQHIDNLIKGSSS